jgi:FkbM family methyltransferase
MELTTKQKMRIARFVAQIIQFFRMFFLRPQRVLVRRKGIYWDLDLWEAIDLSIYLTGRFEKTTQKLMLRGLSDDSVVIDIGANIGAHTLPLARQIRNGMVVAVEPTVWAIDRLRRNLDLNPSLKDRVELIHCGLVETAGVQLETEIYSSWPLPGHGHHMHGGVSHSTSGADAVTLDTLVERLGLTRIDLVKIDVDGHEYSVIQGGSKTFSRFKPPLMMEWSPHQAVEFGHQPSEIIQILKEFGYTPKTSQRKLLTGMAWTALDGLHSGASRNVLFVHRSNTHSPPS